MTHTFLPAASQELTESAAYYEAQRPGLGSEFLVEIKDSIQEVLAHPRRWPSIGTGVRRYRLDRFPYAIVYLVEADAVVIVAVAHLSRQPRYWRRRLR